MLTAYCLVPVHTISTTAFVSMLRLIFFHQQLFQPIVYVLMVSTGGLHYSLSLGFTVSDCACHRLDLIGRVPGSSVGLAK